MLRSVKERLRFRLFHVLWIQAAGAQATRLPFTSDVFLGGGDRRFEQLNLAKLRDRFVVLAIFWLVDPDKGRGKRGPVAALNAQGERKRELRRPGRPGRA